MDTKSSSYFITGPNWTNEKHLHYLSSMEASFVHTMLENNGRLLRLDRYLPDTSDSTLDLKTHRRRKKHAAAAPPATTTTTTTTSSAHDIIGPKTGVNRRADKRFNGRHSYQPYTSSDDQVVPRIGNRREYKDENDPFGAPAN